jgi:peptide deformylase
MAERRVLKMGDPILHEVATAVTRTGTPELTALVDDLWDTMRARNGAGIAAPQIGVGLRVVVFAAQARPQDLSGMPGREAVPETVLVNPVITPLSEEKAPAWEGCLSVPGMRGLVSRYTHIHYSGTDAEGTLIDREVRGFHALVIQHECDHLDGILYPQRIDDLAQFGFEDEISLAGRYFNYPC